LSELFFIGLVLGLGFSKALSQRGPCLFIRQKAKSRGQKAEGRRQKASEKDEVKGIKNGGVNTKQRE
jgi:hypothetical protein